MGSYFQLVGVPSLFKGFDVRLSECEVLDVVLGASIADEGAVGDVGLGRFLTPAVDTCGIGIIVGVVDGALDEVMLLDRLRH